MTHVFGPVPSRRLGRSLGVDPVPLKTCNWNCVYCQLGRSRPLQNKRRDYGPAELIARQVQDRLTHLDPSEVDWLTLVGSGEPLLHSRLGWLIQRIKEMTALPLAVITNGSLLYLPEVRAELLAADAVLPTLDAGNAALYRKLNRPHPAISFPRLIEGLREFRREYHGSLWVEVMLVAGGNDDPEALSEIGARLAAMRPDEIHINLPIRPPAEPWVRPPDEETIRRAAAQLAAVAPVLVARPADGTFDLSGGESLADALLAIIQRHPISEAELVRLLRGASADRLRGALAQLRASGRASVVVRHGARFWTAANSFYGS